MGKSFGNNKRVVCATLLCLAVTFSVGRAYASQREFELFDRGYNYFLSYEPAKAAEAFKSFLGEFPGSSSRDAALFWLGKSLVQINELAEAKLAFAEIKKVSPRSPYAAFADKELESLSNTPLGSRGATDKRQAAEELDVRLKDTEKMTALTGEDLSKAQEERDRLKLLVEDERKKAAEMKNALEAQEARDAEVRKSLEAKLVDAEKRATLLDKERGEALQERDLLKSMLEKEQKKPGEAAAQTSKEQGKGREGKAPEASTQDAPLLEARLGEAEQKAQAREDDLRKAREERDTLAALLEEERKKREESREMKAIIEGKEAQIKELTVKYESRQRQIGEIEKALASYNEEREKIQAELQALKNDKTKAEAERDALQGRVQEYESAITALKGRSESELAAALQTKDDIEAKHRELEKKAADIGEGLSEAEKERDRLRQLVEEERKKSDEIRVALSTQETRDAEALKSLERRLDEAEKTAALREKERIVALQEREDLKTMLGAEQRKTEELGGRIRRAEEVEAEAKALEASVQERSALEAKLRDAERKADVSEGELRRAREERDELKSLLEQEKALMMREREELKTSLKDLGVVAVRIDGVRYAAPQIMEYMMNSLLVVNKMGIKNIAWRSSALYDDFINEQILYDEAKRLDTKGDVKRAKELVKQYSLEKGEADYLLRYIAICALLDRKLRERPDEVMVETISVPFKEDDRFEKAAFTATLLKEAQNARSLEDMGRRYSDQVTYRLVDFMKLQEWQRRKVRASSDRAPVAVSTDTEYMILKVVRKKLLLRPFEEVAPGTRDRIHEVVHAWISELRMKNKSVVIEGT